MSLSVFPIIKCGLYMTIPDPQDHKRLGDNVGSSPTIAMKEHSRRRRLAILRMQLAVNTSRRETSNQALDIPQVISETPYVRPALSQPPRSIITHTIRPQCQPKHWSIFPTPKLPVKQIRSAPWLLIYHPNLCSLL